MKVNNNTAQHYPYMVIGGLLLVLILSFLTGCAHQNSGIRYYEPVTKVNKDGNRYQKQELVASIATDMPGVTSLTVGRLHVEWIGEAMLTEEAVYDRKGNFITKLSQRYLPGFYPSHTIRAQGEATARVVDSSAAGVTGAVISTGGAAAAGTLPGAISSVFAP